MRVLWLTNHLLPEHAVALGKTSHPVGGWMPALADALTTSGQVELGIATYIPGKSWSQQRINNKIFYSIPEPSSKIDLSKLPSALVQSYQRVVDEFKPDVIHIHGTEYFQGLLTGRKHIECPTVISIQGILDVCKDHYWGGIPFFELVKSRTLRDWIRFDGLIEQKLKISRRALWEQEIFATNTAFIGRTLWDKAHARRMNPTARYYHCEEMLRVPFYETSWKLSESIRHTIYVSSATYPLKGFHILLKAVSLLSREFPDIQLRVPSAHFYHTLSGMKYAWKQVRSGGYALYLTDFIRREGLEKHVISLGTLDASGVADELRKAHVFVLPSFIENSSNSLAEAMLVGTPSVVSFTGGVPSMVDDGTSALCFPPGDEVLLAEQIRSVFLYDGLANALSAGARDTAVTRQTREKIVGDMIDIYRSVANVQGQ